MRFKRFAAAVGCLFILCDTVIAQECVRTGLNNTIVTSSCNQTCRDLVFQIPDLRSTSDYTVVDIPYNPYPFTTPGGSEDVSIYDDDKFSNIINLPFPFCFYDDVYNRAVVGSNGLVSFDINNAGCFNAWNITDPIAFSGGNICASANYYPGASIMAAFSDLDPRPGPTSGVNSSPPDRKIEWRVEGTAPCRRFVVSYYKIGVYQATTCGLNTPATFQIVMYESSGLIDIYFENKSCTATSSNGTRAILGVKNMARNKSLAAPGKDAVFWTASNEGYRFVPSGGASRFVSAELLTIAMVPVAIATTANTTPGLLDITFSNVCSTNPSTQYIIRSTYSACENSANLLYSLDTITVTLSEMQANINSTGTSCSGATNGTITVTPLNGVGPYSYSLDGAPTVAGGAPYTFNNVPAGPHIVLAYDAFNCTTQALPVTVAVGPPLNTSVNKTDVLCNGAATGTITVTQPAMGTPVYEYSLDGINWQTNNTFTGLAANIYTVYYREGAGCQGSQQITIGEPPILSAIAASTPVICNGQSNGVITITATGGVAPYQYSIDGGATWQASNVFNVVANNYTVTIRDANNCITTQPVVVTQPVALTANSNNSNATCNGGNDGVITITANGGNSGYQYSIDGVNFQASNIFNVVPGNYVVTVKDSKGCTTTFPAVVGLTNDLTFTPQADPTICEGKSVQLNLVSNGLTYAWTPATALSSTTIPNPVANPTVSTQYIVTTTFGRCTANDTVIVNVNAAPIPNAGADGFICYGQTYTLQASGGTQYAWSPSDYLSNPQIANPVSSAPRDMIYTLSIISDVNGCASLTTDDMRLDVTPPIKINTFPFDTIAYTGDILQFLAVPSDTDVINFSWIPSIGMSNPGIANPGVTAGAVGEDILYQVIGSTIAGCKGEGYVRLRVYKGPDIYVPTGFTPNGDGRNDKFTPFPVGIKSLKYFRVFNRWGQIVFATSRLHDGWDGRVNGVVQPTGTYVWMAEALTNENKVITKKGTVTLIH